MQADAYAGFNRPREAGRKPAPSIEVSCACASQLFDLIRLDKGAIAIEAVERINLLFAIERDLNGSPPGVAGHGVTQNEKRAAGVPTARCPRPTETRRGSPGFALSTQPRGDA
jgi:hypothetical protein